MEKAFKMFDSDGNGFIEKSELSAILGGTELSEDTWNNILLECDLNGDGKVSYLIRILEIVNLFIFLNRYHR